MDEERVTDCAVSTAWILLCARASEREIVFACWLVYPTTTRWTYTTVAGKITYVVQPICLARCVIFISNGLLAIFNACGWSSNIPTPPCQQGTKPLSHVHQ